MSGSGVVSLYREAPSRRFAHRAPAIGTLQYEYDCSMDFSVFWINTTYRWSMNTLARSNVRAAKTATRRRERG